MTRPHADMNRKNDKASIALVNFENQRPENMSWMSKPSEE